jgi:hypothetical protein
MKLVLLFLFSAGAYAQTTWTGLLLDGDCVDRSLENMLSPPAQEMARAKPVTNQVAGISVAPGVVKAERGDVLLPHTLDHASRYQSASCAITAETKSFALLLLPKGPLLELNEAGNTFAMESFEDTPAGREILDGKVGGLKPHAIVKGLRQGDELRAAAVILVTGAEK